MDNDNNDIDIEKMMQSLLGYTQENKIPNLINPDDDNEIDLKAIRKDVVNVATTFRWTNQVLGNLPAPFGDYLDLCHNFVYIYDQIKASVPDVSSDLEEELNEVYRDLRVSVRTFDHILGRELTNQIKRAIQYTKQGREVLPEEIVGSSFCLIGLQNKEYNQWLFETAGKVQKFYSVYRGFTNTRCLDFPVLESFLYFALIGYKLKRLAMLQQRFNQG